MDEDVMLMWVEINLFEPYVQEAVEDIAPLL